MILALKEYQANPGTYYFINDHLGTPQQLVTASGAIVWQAAYLPYGQAQIKTATVANNLRFPGQYYDGETGLHYNWNRFYDPDSGRYISADPIGLDGGMNLYSYVANNPVNWVDPWGLRTWTILDFERGWVDMVNFADTTWCKHRQKTWEKGFQKCVDQLEVDLGKCKNSCIGDSSNNDCETIAREKFQKCINNNNDDNGINYPNARCYYKGFLEKLPLKFKRNSNHLFIKTVFYVTFTRN